jgi:hypothetical protein
MAGGHDFWDKKVSGTTVPVSFYRSIDKVIVWRFENRRDPVKVLVKFTGQSKTVGKDLYKR